MGGADVFSLSPSNGSAPAGTLSGLNVQTTSLVPTISTGARYGLIRIVDPAALNSPQYVTAVLEVVPIGSLPVPELSGPGAVFVTQAGSTVRQTSVIQVNASSVASVAFQAAGATVDGGNWLQVTPTTGTASTASPGQVTISVNPAGLAANIYKGHVVVSMSGAVRTQDVTLIVAPAATATAAARAATGCTASRLAITTAGISDSFATPAGWPANLILRLNDDCGNPVMNGAVVASFSNGDPPLSVASDFQTGTYSVTWQPGQAASPMTVTLRATAGTLPSVTAQLTGTVTSNSAPVLARGGTLNNLNPLVGAPLAPGTVAQVFGSGLASSTVSPGVVPLYTAFNGTTMLAGGLEAPLYYLSSQQLTVQIPNELAPNRQYAVIVSANGALTLPDTISLVGVQPGVAQFPDGRITAQHSADFSLVDASRPAKPGEVLIMYLVGMGATNPSVKSGTPAPGNVLVPATLQPSVSVDGQNVEIAFAGLTPGGIGLFQINFRVPAGARTGTLDVTVNQGGVVSNTTQLPVSR